MEISAEKLERVQAGSSGAEFGGDPSSRNRLSPPDGIRQFKRWWDGTPPRRWDESNERANKSLKTFLLKVRGMCISARKEGGSPTSNLNSFKVADPSKRDRRRGRGRRNSMRCRYRYLLKRVAKPAPDQVPVARK